MISIATPQIVRVGSDAVDQLPEILGLLGARRPFLVVDPYFRGSDMMARVGAALAADGRSAALFHDLVPDPTSASVEEGVRQARLHCADAVVGIGGGSAIDTAKAVALLAVHDVALRTLRAPYRVVEKGLPLVAVPTTAGTGSEATRFCLVTDSGTGDKMACIGEGFMPAAALIDDTLTMSVPARVTADTGIDAFTHALEAYVGRKANVFSDLYAEKALVLIAKALPALMHDLSDRQARADMMLGSYLAGTAFSNSGLALAHAMSAPLGGTFHVPHGLSIAILLPAVTRFSVARAPAPYAKVARLLGIGSGGEDEADASAFMAWLDGLMSKLSVPTLSSRGVNPATYAAAVDAMAKDSPRSGAAANNPVVAGHEDIVSLFHAVWA